MVLESISNIVIIVGIIKVFRSNKSLQKYFSSFEAALAGMQVSNQQISNT